MCTVTYIKRNNQVFLTSNRDVPLERSSKKVVSEYVDGSELLYPKDATMGGTWIGTNSNNRTACLLNGAFENHVSKPPYRMSRGKMVLRYFHHPNVLSFVENFEFRGMEPFTMIICEFDKLFELRWTEKETVSFKALDEDKAYIWSSSTLYTPEIQQKREALFAKFLSETPHITQNKIIDFHRTASLDDPHNDLVMNRDGKVQTVSVTNIWIHDHRTTLRFYELHSEQLASFTLKHEMHFS